MVLQDLAQQTVTLTYEQFLSVVNNQTAPLIMSIGFLSTTFLICLLLLIFTLLKLKRVRRFFKEKKLEKEYAKWAKNEASI